MLEFLRWGFIVLWRPWPSQEIRYLTNSFRPGSWTPISHLMLHATSHSLLHRGTPIPSAWPHIATEFCTAVPQIFRVNIEVLVLVMCRHVYHFTFTEHRKRHMTVMSKGHYRTAGPQYGNGFCHPSGSQNMEVAAGHLENLKTATIENTVVA